MTLYEKLRSNYFKKLTDEQEFYKNYAETEIKKRISELKEEDGEKGSVVITLKKMNREHCKKYFIHSIGDFKVEPQWSWILNRCYVEISWH
jgi:hypothetical protein